MQLSISGMWWNNATGFKWPMVTLRGPFRTVWSVQDLYRCMQVLNQYQYLHMYVCVCIHWVVYFNQTSVVKWLFSVQVLHQNPLNIYLAVWHCHIFFGLRVVNSWTGQGLSLFHCPATQRLLVWNLSEPQHKEEQPWVSTRFHQSKFPLCTESSESGHFCDALTVI